MPQRSTAATGTLSTVVFTAKPIAMAMAAEIRIWYTEPGVFTFSHRVFFGSSTRSIVSTTPELWTCFRGWVFSVERASSLRSLDDIATGV
ncbi:hypothetical protein I7I53_08619 [Histoplasma capsulatum var. duboisii H88]|uniref:Uncharacterized protein n=1 Tax=Ajellomyces capsulatus (strain H88) TaxID=544711 RepID=A0A8A1LK87_AJEC8|nr:hypothetical protein I7I53_08619 [Histoplasma capsulatum var. duboisii H88]